MNLAQINSIRVAAGLAPREVKKPKAKNNNAAERAQANRDMKAKRAKR